MDETANTRNTRTKSGNRLITYKPIFGLPGDFGAHEGDDVDQGRGFDHGGDFVGAIDGPVVEKGRVRGKLDAVVGSGVRGLDWGLGSGVWGLGALGGTNQIMVTRPVRRQSQVVTGEPKAILDIRIH